MSCLSDYNLTLKALKAFERLPIVTILTYASRRFLPLYYEVKMLKNLKKKKKLYGPFLWMRLTTSRLEPLWGGSLLFTTKFPEIPGTHFIDLGRMKGWVDLGATQWFWTRNLWIGNPAPLPLGHWSLVSLTTLFQNQKKKGKLLFMIS